MERIDGNKTFCSTKDFREKNDVSSDVCVESRKDISLIALITVIDIEYPLLLFDKTLPPYVA